MKFKYRGSLMIVLVTLYCSLISCDKGTELEPAVSQRVELWNQRDSTVRIDFVFQQDTNSIQLLPNDRREVGLYVNPPPSISGELNGLPYTNFTDAIVYFGNNSLVYSENNCVSSLNPLCIRNYSRIKDTVENQRRNVIDLFVFD